MGELSLVELVALLLEMLLDRLLVLLLEVMATLEELEELSLEPLVVEVLELQLAMPWKTLFQEGKARARVSSEARVEKVSLEAKAKERARDSLEAKVGRVSLEARVKARARMVRAKERVVRAREKAKEKGGAWTLR